MYHKICINLQPLIFDTKDNKYHNKDEENHVFRLHDGICNDG